MPVKKPLPKLTHWSARRAGGAITLSGVNEAGEIVKIVGIWHIMRENNDTIVATHRNGLRYELT